MNTLRNKTRTPLRVPLGGGRFLHLGPSASAAIGDRAARGAAVLRLVEEGRAELIGAAGAAEPRGEGGADPLHVLGPGSLVVAVGSTWAADRLVAKADVDSLAAEGYVLRTGALGDATDARAS